MSKRQGLYLGCLFLLFSQCKKQNDNASSGYWSLGYGQDIVRYSINYTSRQDSLGYAVLKGTDKLPSSSQPLVNSIYLFFASPLPVKNGSYEMVNFQYTNTPLANNQLGISGFLPVDALTQCANSNAYFDATGVASIASWPWPLSGSAQVTIQNGKIKVVIPQTIARYGENCGLDSPYLNLIFQEK